MSSVERLRRAPGYINLFIIPAFLSVRAEELVFADARGLIPAGRQGRRFLGEEKKRATDVNNYCRIERVKAARRGKSTTMLALAQGLFKFKRK